MDVTTWQVFVMIGVLVMIAEVFIPGMIFLPIGLGMLVSAIFASFVTNSALLYLLTAIICAGVFTLFRKLSHGDKDAPPATAVDAMIGKEVKIIEEVSTSHAGSAKLYGDVWKALSIDPDVIFLKDEIGVIKKVEGNKIFISKK